MVPPSVPKSLKRKRGAATGSAPFRPSKHGASKKPRHDDDDDTASDASREEGAGFGLDDIDLRRTHVQEETDEEDDNETPAAKRLRLAKLYLDSVKNEIAQGDGAYDAADVDREIIAARLQKDVLQHSGKLHDRVAASVSRDQLHLPFLRVRGHRLPVTCAVASQDGTTLFTSSKEGSIIKWDLHTGKQVVCFLKKRTEKGKGRQRGGNTNEEVEGHTDEVFALALSDDGQYLASGGQDRRLGLWDARLGKWIRGFGGHKDAITSITFRKGTSQFFTASLDRTVKLWDASVLAYVETLFGHQNGVTCIDALRAETAITSGGRDTSVRFWKVIEESQLVFRGGGKSKMREVLEAGLEDVEAEEQVEAARRSKKSTGYVEGCIECVAMVDEATFLSGGDSGSLCLWNVTKKKPLFTQALAHGVNEVLSETEGPIRTPRWITSLATLPYSDLFASGSWDGVIRLWKIESSGRAFAPIAEVPAPGFVNSLQLLSPPYDKVAHATWAKDSSQPNGQTNGSNGAAAQKRAIMLVAGMGQEPRMGRWMRIKGPEAQNAAFVIPLRLTDA